MGFFILISVVMSFNHYSSVLKLFLDTGTAS